MFRGNLSKLVIVYENVFDSEVLCMLSIQRGLPLLGGVSGECGCDQYELWRLSLLLFYFFCSLLAIHQWYLEYGRACSVFDHPKIFAIS